MDGIQAWWTVQQGKQGRCSSSPHSSSLEDIKISQMHNNSFPVASCPGPVRPVEVIYVPGQLPIVLIAGWTAIRSKRQLPDTFLPANPWPAPAQWITPYSTFFASNFHSFCILLQRTSTFSCSWKFLENSFGIKTITEHSCLPVESPDLPPKSLESIETHTQTHIHI